MLLQFRKKGKIERFQIHYDNLIKEANRLTKVNKELSEQKFTEAEITLKLIFKLKNNKI